MTRLKGLFGIFCYFVAFISKSCNCFQSRNTNKFGKLSFFKMDSTSSKNNNDEFDPRISPHFYGKAKRVEKSSVNDNDDFDPRISPHFYGDDEARKVENSVDLDDDQKQYLSYQKNNEKLNLSSVDVFDPRLSPHVYSNGISSKKIGLHYPQKIGVLLIDHGSRRQESNLHLESIASEYQKKYPNEIIVRAAHMEISEPSIEQGIKMLLELEVSKIICHPFFLSPGKHSTYDIPNLISAAKENISSNIPIFTTDPLGSNVDFMVNAIENAVQNRIKKEEQII